jgi:membrane protein YqaA with SNARE-associated domain
VYAQEIATTNFTALALQADAFVATTVLPGVNQMLLNGILLPQNSNCVFFCVV